MSLSQITMLLCVVDDKFLIVHERRGEYVAEVIEIDGVKPKDVQLLFCSGVVKPEFHSFAIVPRNVERSSYVVNTVNGEFRVARIKPDGRRIKHIALPRGNLRPTLKYLVVYEDKISSCELSKNPAQETKYFDNGAMLDRIVYSHSNNEKAILNDGSMIELKPDGIVAEQPINQNVMNLDYDDMGFGLDGSGDVFVFPPFTPPHELRHKKLILRGVKKIGASQGHTSTREEQDGNTYQVMSTFLYYLKHNNLHRVELSYVDENDGALPEVGDEEFVATNVTNFHIPRQSNAIYYVSNNILYLVNHMNINEPRQLLTVENYIVFPTRSKYDVRERSIRMKSVRTRR